MNPFAFLGALAAAGFMASGAAAQTREAVQERGALTCGVEAGVPGFATKDANDVWQGFDVAICRAVAAAVLRDPTAVSFVATEGDDRFEALAQGDVDVLVRNATWTFGRDVDPRFTFAGITYFDGQGFMINRGSGYGSALELDGASVCVRADTARARNLEGYFANNNMEIALVPTETNADAHAGYVNGDCEVYTNDVSALAATRAGFADPDSHAILPEVISKEPLGLVVRSDDPEWAAVIRWSFNALVAAEELGVTSANIDELAQGTSNPEVNRLLGAEGDLGAMLGLDAGWAVRAISAGGNYGEIFASTIGEQTPIGLARGLNALWTQGGLLYTPPFR